MEVGRRSESPVPDAIFGAVGISGAGLVFRY